MRENVRFELSGAGSPQMLAHCSVCPRIYRSGHQGAKTPVAKLLWVENIGANAMNFLAGLQSSSDPGDEASLKRIEALFRSRATLHLRRVTGSRGEAKPSA